MCCLLHAYAEVVANKADNLCLWVALKDKLNELDITGVEPMSHVFPVNNVFREDVVENGDGREQTLANAPEEKDDAFVVPKTIVG